MECHYRGDPPLTCITNSNEVAGFGSFKSSLVASFIKMTGYVRILSIIICIRIAIIRWIITYLGIMDPEQVVSLTIAGRRVLVSYPSALDLDYSGNWLILGK